MCGIVGYIGDRPAAPILLDGLARLEYRGYDSAGIALSDLHGGIAVHKTPGKLSSLVQSLAGVALQGTSGIGHTRWATHGTPNTVNAHPHTDCKGKVAIVHNGIVENYRQLKEGLGKEGHRFESETDSEVVAHVIEAYLESGLPFAEAVRRTAQRLAGASAIVAMHAQEPDIFVVFRLGNAGGITVGYCDGAMLVASDLPAMLPQTNRVVFLAPGELAKVTRGGASYQSLEGKAIAKEPRTVTLDPISVAKGGYKHFMLKEIMEQPEAVTHTLRGAVNFPPSDVVFPGSTLTQADLAEMAQVVLVGMGTSMHAAQAGRFMIEQLAGLPAEVDNASEFRYRDPVLSPHTLLVSVGQSGETADTLGAMEEAAKHGVRQVTVCNAEGSQATRMADGTVYIGVGPEIGVASTKSLTGSLVGLYLLAVYLGKVRGTLDEARVVRLLEDLSTVPRLIGESLKQRGWIEELAQFYFKFDHFLFLGRGITTSIAMEGALKLKEVSYIHAEGYAAGEMKHGPIALIDQAMPVVAVVPRGNLYEKMVANIEEVKARGGRVIALVTQGDTELKGKVDHIIQIPESPLLLIPMVAVVPLQLFAYYIAVHRGCDVDQPRNLAKTVTVE